MPFEVMTEFLHQFITRAFVARRKNIPALLLRFGALNTIEVAVLTWN
jgi:hypothetical protein